MTADWYRIDDPENPPPKDGTPFFTFSEDAARENAVNVYGFPGTPILVMAWHPFTGSEPFPIDEQGEQIFTHCWQPTHWLPFDALPPPPVTP